MPLLPAWFCWSSLLGWSSFSVVSKVRCYPEAVNQNADDANHKGDQIDQGCCRKSKPGEELGSARRPNWSHRTALYARRLDEDGRRSAGIRGSSKTGLIEDGCGDRGSGQPPAQSGGRTTMRNAAAQVAQQTLAKRFRLVELANESLLPLRQFVHGRSRHGHFRKAAG